MSAKAKRAGKKRFYADALSKAEQSEFPAALEIEGVDEEIALLRLRLRTALVDHPEDLALMFKGVDLLTRLVATRYRLSKDDERDLLEDMQAGLRQEVGALMKAAS